MPICPIRAPRVLQLPVSSLSCLTAGALSPSSPLPAAQLRVTTSVGAAMGSEFIISCPQGGGERPLQMAGTFHPAGTTAGANHRDGLAAACSSTWLHKHSKWFHVCLTLLTAVPGRCAPEAGTCRAPRRCGWSGLQWAWAPGHTEARLMRQNCRR